MKPVNFGGRLIGDGEPAFVIAEAGVNHNGDLELGRALIREAAAAGADAIKFQSYKAGKISTRTAPRYWVEADDPNGSQYDTFKKLDSFGPEEHEELFRYSKERGILCFSAPFDDEAVDMLDALGAPGFKIASADLTDYPLLERAASKGKPVILSTGLATIAEIGEAVSVVRGTGNDQLVLLHCTLQYPCAPENANLRMMLHMKAAFPDIPVGISDHTLGIAVPQAAVALGAVAVEKHYTVDKTLPGSPDHYLSVDPRDSEGDGLVDTHHRKSDGALSQGTGRGGVAGVQIRAAKHRFEDRHSARDRNHPGDAHLQAPRHGHLSETRRPGRRAHRESGHPRRHRPRVGNGLMRVIFVVPARGGDREVPYLNIKRLGGLPLIAHTLVEAGKSRYPHTLVVSTDDDQVAQVAREYGAERGPAPGGAGLRLRRAQSHRPARRHLGRGTGENPVRRRRDSAGHLALSSRPANRRRHRPAQ